MRAIIRDLVVDVRCAERDGMPEYAEKCRQQIATLYYNRHGAKLNRYGWPVIDGKPM